MSEEIDWTQQWEIYSPGFKNGLATIPLPGDSQIQLAPGPGFGDYSHPTTRLMVDMMAEHVPGQVIFDIGCGSGILSIAAAKLGAKELSACDISSDAIAHTKKNAELNNLTISFSSPTKKPVILMNMIFSEQKSAWKQNALPFYLLITSGILSLERESYLEYARSQNWELIQEKESTGWLSCIFKEFLS